jgi:stress response protein SCP2
LQENYGNATAVVFGEIFRANSGAEWQFKAIGQPHQGGFHELKAKYY